MTTYLAFRSPQSLADNTDLFIEKYRQPNNRTEPALLTAIMTEFLDEALKVYFLDPLDIVGIGGAPRKIVEVTANTISKTSHAMLKQTVKKMDAKQTRDAADYMDDVRQQFDGQWHVTIPLDDDFAHRLRAGMQKAREEGPQVALPELCNNLVELTDIALAYYFEKPIAIMQFGPILKKLTNVALDTIRKVTKSTIHKVFAKMTDDQVLKSCDYMSTLLIDASLKESNPEPVEA